MDNTVDSAASSWWRANVSVAVRPREEMRTLNWSTMKVKEGRECDGSLESPSPSEGEGRGGEGPSPSSDAVRGIATRTREDDDRGKEDDDRRTRR